MELGSYLCVIRLWWWIKVKSQRWEAMLSSLIMMDRLQSLSGHSLLFRRMKREILVSNVSFICRSSHVFQCTRDKWVRPCQLSHVIITCGHYLGCGCESLPIHWCNYLQCTVSSSMRLNSDCSKEFQIDAIDLSLWLQWSLSSDSRLLSLLIHKYSYKLQPYAVPVRCTLEASLIIEFLSNHGWDGHKWVHFHEKERDSLGTRLQNS